MEMARLIGQLAHDLINKLDELVIVNTIEQLGEYLAKWQTDICPGMQLALFVRQGRTILHTINLGFLDKLLKPRRDGPLRGHKRWIEERAEYDIIVIMDNGSERATRLMDAMVPRLADLTNCLVIRRPLLDKLKPKERHILQCMMEGLADHETAELVGLTPRTVRDKINKIKLMHNATNRCHLMTIVFGLQHIVQKSGQDYVFARTKNMTV